MRYADKREKATTMSMSIEWAAIDVRFKSFMKFMISRVSHLVK
jgi:hypothetical protein